MAGPLQMCLQDLAILPFRGSVSTVFPKTLYRCCGLGTYTSVKNVDGGQQQHPPCEILLLVIPMAVNVYEVNKTVKLS